MGSLSVSTHLCALTFPVLLIGSLVISVFLVCVPIIFLVLMGRLVRSSLVGVLVGPCIVRLPAYPRWYLV